VVEYVEEMDKFCKLTDDEDCLFNCMLSQSHITENMRMILVDWLVEVHIKYQLFPEILYLQSMSRMASFEDVCLKEVAFGW